MASSSQTAVYPIYDTQNNISMNPIVFSLHFAVPFASKIPTRHCPFGASKVKAMTLTLMKLPMPSIICTTSCASSRGQISQIPQLLARKRGSKKTSSQSKDCNWPLGSFQKDIVAREFEIWGATIRMAISTGQLLFVFEASIFRWFQTRVLGGTLQNFFTFKHVELSLSSPWMMSSRKWRSAFVCTGALSLKHKRLQQWWCGLMLGSVSLISHA